MTAPRASLVVIGEVVVAARPDGLETVEAIGVAEGRVVSAGARRDVLDAAGAAARVIDAGKAAVVPGLHDFHLHLVGLARSRRAVALDGAADFAEVVRRVETAVRDLPRSAWVTGRGWSEATLDQGQLTLLEAAVGERPALLTSHDGHSAWASASARRLAGLTAASADPAGGRLERDRAGEPNGVLREVATEEVSRIAGRLTGDALAQPVAETLGELAALGVTGATDAGDYTDAGGIGADAALGDSFSNLSWLASEIDGRLRLTLDIPADAIAAAASAGLRTGDELAERATLRFGWAKAYADGALGSRTAALFTPYSCGTADRGILRLSPEQLDAIIGGARQAGIAVAIHAIGDRAAAAVLDAVERSGPRVAGVPADRMEHAQLVRPMDRPRFGALGVTASVQPIHAAADRHAVEACWADKAADAFPWASMAALGARLAFGSDAPIESVNPWEGCFAAVHRRFANDPPPDWRAGEAVDAVSALSAYTLGAASALGRRDEGHLRPGAHADLAVLNVDVSTLVAADERLAAVRSELTLVGGREVHRS